MTDLYSHPSLHLQAVHVCTLVAVRFPCVALHSADASEGLTQMNRGGSEMLCGDHGIGCTRCLQPLRPWQATPTPQKSVNSSDDSEIRVVHIQGGQVEWLDLTGCGDGPMGNLAGWVPSPTPCHSRPSGLPNFHGRRRRLMPARAGGGGAPRAVGRYGAPVAVGERELPQCSQGRRRGRRKTPPPQLARRSTSARRHPSPRPWIRV